MHLYVKKNLSNEAKRFLHCHKVFFFYFIFFNRSTDTDLQFSGHVVLMQQVTRTVQLIMTHYDWTQTLQLYLDKVFKTMLLFCENLSWKCYNYTFLAGLDQKFQVHPA